LPPSDPAANVDASSAPGIRHPLRRQPEPPSPSVPTSNLRNAQHPTPDRKRPAPHSAKIGSPEPIAALNRVKILEYALPWMEREPLVDIRAACPDLVIVGWVCPYLRRTVAQKLNAAQASLPPGYRLKVFSAARTLSMQQHGWDNYNKRLREEHPNWPLSALRRATNRYFAPYDQKAPPGHCTGGAVDVGLLDPEGNALDMTAPTKGWEAAYTWSDKISPEAKANRMLMVEAMLSAGFSNCRDEFWHYSWGDSAWAVRVGEKECPYGWTYPPVALETDFEGASATGLQIESRRDDNGKVIEAEGSCAVPEDAPLTPEGLPAFRVGLYWAYGVPVTLRIHWPQPVPDSLTLYLGDGKQEWQPWTDFRREGDSLLLQMTPHLEQAVLTDHLPPAKEETDASTS